jgi:hypothetical protein
VRRRIGEDTLSCCEAMSHRSAAISASWAAVHRRPLTYARLRPVRPRRISPWAGCTTRRTTSSRSLGIPGRLELGAARDPGSMLEERLHLGLVGPAADEIGARSAPEDERQRVDQHRLAGAGLAGDTLKPGASSSTSRSMRTMLRTVSWTSTPRTYRPEHSRRVSRVELRRRAFRRPPGTVRLTRSSGFTSLLALSVAMPSAAPKIRADFAQVSCEGHLRRDAVPSEREKKARRPRPRRRRSRRSRSARRTSRTA